MTALLVLEEVQRYFGGVKALDGVSGSLEEGRILGLIGPNGSGKTTLLNLLSSVMEPTGGTIRVDGRDTRRWSPRDASKAGIARVFQVPMLMTNLTVLENVAVGALFGWRRPSGKAANVAALEALEAVRLGHRAGTICSSLTGVERKSLELARAMAAAPRIALVDEVMAGKSMAEVREAEQVLLALRDRGTTLIVVEHVLGVVANIADEVCVLNQGRVLRWGAPAEVMADPAVVAAYLGAHHD
jgi:branched-chain amino acid transport system permease protein